MHAPTTRGPVQFLSPVPRLPHRTTVGRRFLAPTDLPGGARDRGLALWAARLGTLERGVLKGRPWAALGGVQRWAFSGEDALVCCRTRLPRGRRRRKRRRRRRRRCRGTPTGAGRRGRMRRRWRSFGGRNGRPGQCKPGCLPDDTVDRFVGSSRWSIPFFSPSTRTSPRWDRAAEMPDVPALSYLRWKLRRVHLSARVVSETKVSTLPCAGIIREKERKREKERRERKTRFVYSRKITGAGECARGVIRNFHLPLGSSRCQQVTGWCRSNIFNSDRSSSIRGICMLLRTGDHHVAPRQSVFGF